MSKLFPSVVETATGLAGSTLSNSSTGLSRISANEFPCRTSILIISGDSLYIHCITVQARTFYAILGFRKGCSESCEGLCKDELISVVHLTDCTVSEKPRSGDSPRALTTLTNKQARAP